MLRVCFIQFVVSYFSSHCRYAHKITVYQFMVFLKKKQLFYLLSVINEGKAECISSTFCNTLWEIFFQT